ncbi:urease accessory protein UreD [Fodinicola feengrottensis]|uniref:Urease accessory protein UreD n=1 Tax=Fodinicola feengrottensis TaxID=435914 RepID=A0ABN2HUC9_9ACTN
MKAEAYVHAELDASGRTILRTLRSAAPITLLPRRRPESGAAVVHLVGSGAAPLGGDDLTVTVRVGPGARLRIRGVAASVALPGQHAGCSRTRLRLQVEAGGELDYQPEPTVVTARAHHQAEVVADLAGDARLRLADTVVLGRAGEASGRLDTSLRVRRDGQPMLHQEIALGDPVLDASVAVVAGRRVLVTEFRCGENDPVEAVSGDWWSLVPLAAGGSLLTVLAPDAITAARCANEARQST